MVVGFARPRYFQWTASTPGRGGTPPRGSETTRSQLGSIRPDRSSASGASASSRSASPDSRHDLAGGGQPSFPPSVVVAVKALACELPHEHHLPLSRLSIPDIRREAVRRGLVASIGETTGGGALSRCARVSRWTGLGGTLTA